MKIVLLLICLFTFINNNTAWAAPLVNKGTTIAIMDFGTHKGASTYDISLTNAEEASSEYILARFASNENFIVREKDLMKNELEEANLKTTGIIDARQLREIGRILDARYIVYGNVNDVSASENGTNVASPLPNLGGDVTVYTVSCHIIGRVIDVETGYIIAAAKGSGKSRSSMTEIKALKAGIRVGTVTVTQASVHNAIREAAYNTVDILTNKLLGIEESKINKEKRR